MCLNVDGIFIYLCLATSILSKIAFISFAVGIVFFMYVGMKYVMNAGNDKERTQLKKALSWGIVAIFVGASIWGLVQIVSFTVGVPVDGTVRPGRYYGDPFVDPFFFNQ